MKKTPLKRDTFTATRILRGKIVKEVVRHKRKEMGIFFTDGSRLFVDQTLHGLELSITNCSCTHPVNSKDRRSGRTSKARR